MVVQLRRLGALRPRGPARHLLPGRRSARRPTGGHRGLTILSEAFLSERHLLSATLASDLRLADLTAPAAYSFGVTGELSATSDYAQPHWWASLLHAAGFHGVRYHVRHDPTGSQIGVGWFGAAGGLTATPEGYSQPLPAELLLAAAPFGIRIAGNLPAE